MRPALAAAPLQGQRQRNACLGTGHKSSAVELRLAGSRQGLVCFLQDRTASRRFERAALASCLTVQALPEF